MSTDGVVAHREIPTPPPVQLRHAKEVALARRRVEKVPIGSGPGGVSRRVDAKHLLAADERVTVMQRHRTARAHVHTIEAAFVLHDQVAALVDEAA
jgi:hypothetical protein